MTIFAIIMAVAGGAQLSRPQRRDAQRKAARAALDHSARLANLPVGAWSQDENGVPVSVNGVYGSIAHKPAWAAAIAAPQPVGIDIEHVRPRRVEFFDAIADRDEWARLGSVGIQPTCGASENPLTLPSPPQGERGFRAPSEHDWPAFFRLWTAKEATLKANRVGLEALDHCRLLEFLDEHRATMSFDGALWRVDFHPHADHLAAVASQTLDVAWRVIDPLACSAKTTT